MWRTPLLDKTLTAAGTISPYRLVKFSTSDTTVIQASAATDSLIGVSGSVGAASGESVDVTFVGIGEITLGDTVARGGQVTSDASGRGIPAVDGNSVAGKVLKSGVVGDVVPILLHAAGDSDASPLFQADVTITASQLKALNATPQTLVAAPGAGKILVPTLVQLFLDYATTAYDGIAAGEDLNVRYTNGSGALCATIEATGFLDATADAYRWVTPTTAAAVAGVANAALVLHMATGEIATGDSPLKVRTFYRVIDAAF